MLFFLIFALLFSPIPQDKLKTVLEDLKEAYNKSSYELFDKILSEKGKEKWNQGMLRAFFAAHIRGWGNLVEYKLPAKEIEPNIYELETNFDNGRCILKIAISEDLKIDDFEFTALKKIDFERPKVLSKKLFFPFNGSWIVKEGGRNLEKNIFKDTYDKAFALYFQKVNEKGEKENSREQEILAPVDSTVWQIIDNIPENEGGKINKIRPNGNSIVLKISKEEFLAITHLKPESFKVKPGQNVKVGESLALTGFSGDITEPVVGFWAQNNVLEQEGQAIKFYFSCVEVFDGKNWQKKENYFPEKGEILRACTD